MTSTQNAALAQWDIEREIVQAPPLVVQRR